MAILQNLLGLLLIFSNFKTAFAQIKCSDVLPFEHDPTTPRDRHVTAEDLVYTFNEAAPNAGESHQVIFTNGQGIRSADDQYCFVVNGNDFGVYKSSTNTPMWKHTLGGAASVRFVRGDANSQLQFFSGDDVQNDLTYTLQTNNNPWSFYMDPDGMLVLSPDLTDDAQNVFFTECLIITQVPAVAPYTTSIEGITGPTPDNNDDVEIPVPVGAGFRSADQKYCIHRTATHLKFFNGRESTDIVPVTANLQINRRAADNGKFMMVIDGAELSLLTINPVNEHQKELVMQEGALVIKDVGNANSGYLRVSDMLIQKSFRNILGSAGVNGILPTKLTMQDATPFDITMNNAGGALFSEKGDFALTVNADTVAFWKVEPTSERKLLTPSMPGVKAQLKIVRERANSDIFVRLISDGAVVKETKIGESADAGQIVITLGGDTANDQPALLIKRGDANAVVYALSEFDNVQKLSKMTRCQKELSQIGLKHDITGGRPLPNENTLIHVASIGNRLVSQMVKKVLFSTDRKYCLIMNPREGFGVYETETDRYAWQVKGTSLQLILQVQGTQVELFRKRLTRKAKVFAKFSPNHEATLSLNNDGMLTVTTDKPYLVSDEDLANQKTREPTELKCKSANVAGLPSRMEFANTETKTLRQKDGTLLGLLSQNKSVCLLIEEDSVGVYNDMTGRYIWNIPSAYEAIFTFGYNDKSHELHGTLAYRLGGRDNFLTTKNLFTVPAEQGSMVKLTDHGELKVSASNKVYFFDKSYIDIEKTAQSAERPLMCHNIVALSSEDRQNAEMIGPVAEINRPTDGNTAHVVIPLPTNVVGSPKRGLKSADGSVCLYMDENKLKMFDDEQGKIVAQSPMPKANSVMFERTRTHVIFKQGTVQHKIISWNHDGKIRLTFDRASRLIVSSPEKTLVIDIANDFTYTIVARDGIFPGSPFLLRKNQMILSENFECALAHTGLNLEIRKNGVVFGESLPAIKTTKEPRDYPVTFQNNALVANKNGQMSVLKAGTVPNGVRMVLNNECVLDSALAA